MKAKKVCAASSDFLQELSKDLEPISQRDLEDLKQARENLYSPALTAIRQMIDRLEINISCRLQAGVPIERGVLTASLIANWVSVTHDDQEKEPE